MKLSKPILVFIALMLGGCAASGTQFKKVAEIPQDKGVVYVYRANSILGAAVHYDVHAGNEEVICDLIRNGYCVYYAKPGELELWGKTESKSTITIDVKAGQEHFVKGGLSMGFLVGRPNFTAVDNKTGLEEIAECVLLGKPAAEAAVITAAAAPAKTPEPVAAAESATTPQPATTNETAKSSENPK